MWLFTTCGLRDARRIHPGKRGLSALRRLAIAAGCVLLGVMSAQADVGTGAKIELVPDSLTPALEGQPYSATIRVYAGASGTVSHLSISGDRWIVEAAGVATSRGVQIGDVLSIPFVARPEDAHKPLQVEFEFNGRRVRRVFDLSPERFAGHGQAGRTVRIDGLAPVEIERAARAALAAAAPAPRAQREPSSDDPRGGDRTQHLHLAGRLAYQRPDGTTVGADSMWFRIMDDDSPAPDEVMFEGFTNEQGYFNVEFDWDDCDILGCDDPDIYLYWETDNGVVNVQDDSLFEEDYSWSTETSLIPDFTGSFINFGDIMPADMSTHPAMHISNGIVRAHRFLVETENTNLPEIDVQWPESGSDSGAFYNPFFQEIHISAARQWNEITHGHEYGHYYLDLMSVNTEPSYCNNICDSDDCGHCVWCPENADDAWNEGFPNWLGSVVARTYPARYGVSAWAANNDGLYNLEQIASCTTPPGLPVYPNIIEGYTTALLYDMDDASQDDGDGGAPDCDIDSMTVPPAKILEVVRLDQPARLQQFIDRYWARFPLDQQDFWSTVRNIDANDLVVPPLPPPIVLSRPKACGPQRAGDNFTLSITSNGSRLQYQWRQNGANLTDNGRRTGATTPNLQFSPLVQEDTGTYDCIVRTCDGSQSTLSPPTYLEVLGSVAPSPMLAWGYNTNGACGKGNQDSPSPPGPVSVISDAIAVEGDDFHMLAIRADRSVWAAGYNGYGSLGVPPPPNYALTPQPVPGLQNIAKIRVGSGANFAIDAAGALWAWGYNAYGQIDGNIWPTPVPTPRVIPVGCVLDAAVNDLFALVVLEDGTVLSWGNGQSGQLGDGPGVIFRFFPAPVSGLTDVVSISASNSHVLAVKRDGTVWGWGSNAYSQLGLGEGAPLTVYSPVQIPALTQIVKVAASLDGTRSYALNQSGQVWVWGSSNFGALGDGTNGGFRHTPYYLTSLYNVRDIRASTRSFFALGGDGRVRAAGTSYSGIFGDVPDGTQWLLPETLSFIADVRGMGVGNNAVWMLGQTPVAPFITQQPVSVTAAVGELVQLTVAATGVPEPSFQWYRGTEPLVPDPHIFGTQGSTLYISPAQLTDTGEYHVVATNTVGSAISNTLQLTIVVHPADFDGNGHIDANDFQVLAACQHGPGVPVGPECQPADLDNDGDVDTADMALFQRCYTGAAGQPTLACAP